MEPMLPSQAELRVLFDYDPDTGHLIWRLRNGPARSVGFHNLRYAGKIAGSIRITRHTSYLMVDVGGTPRYAHRIAYKWMTGEEPHMVDHVNHNGLDNRFANLRAATAKDNQGNRRGWRSRAGTAKCVSRTRDGKKFRAYMTQNGKYVHLGTFATEEEASAAYRRAAEKYFGAFAASP